MGTFVDWMWKREAFGGARRGRYSITVGLWGNVGVCLTPRIVEEAYGYKHKKNE